MDTKGTKVYTGKGSSVLSVSSDQGFVTRVLEVDNLLYVGKASDGALTSDAVWAITRWTDDGAGNFYSEKADGNSLYDNVWDNLESLPYS